MSRKFVAFCLFMTLSSISFPALGADNFLDVLAEQPSFLCIRFYSNNNSYKDQVPNSLVLYSDSNYYDTFQDLNRDRLRSLRHGKKYWYKGVQFSGISSISDEKDQFNLEGQLGKIREQILKSGKWGSFGHKWLDEKSHAAMPIVGLTSDELKRFTDIRHRGLEVSLCRRGTTDAFYMVDRLRKNLVLEIREDQYEGDSFKGYKVLARSKGMNFTESFRKLQFN